MGYGFEELNNKKSAACCNPAYHFVSYMLNMQGGGEIWYITLNVEV